MECDIYKGKRKQDHYLFLPADASLDEIPESILQLLGEIQHVMKIDITSDTHLAQSEPDAVLEMIKEKGFYIQLPKKDTITI